MQKVSRTINGVTTDYWFIDGRYFKIKKKKAKSEGARQAAAISSATRNKLDMGRSFYNQANAINAKRNPGD